MSEIHQTNVNGIAKMAHPNSSTSNVVFKSIIMKVLVQYLMPHPLDFLVLKSLTILAYFTSPKFEKNDHNFDCDVCKKTRDAVQMDDCTVEPA